MRSMFSVLLCLALAGAAVAHAGQGKVLEFASGFVSDRVSIGGRSSGSRLEELAMLFFEPPPSSIDAGLLRAA